MPVNPKLLELLCCPEDKTSLHPADDTLVSRINESIVSHSLENRGGKKIEEQIEGGLVRADGKFLYPIRDSIPIMLIDEAISLEVFR